MDFCPEDREKVYQYIIDRFGIEKVCYISQFGTLKDRGTIDVISKGLDYTNLDIVKEIKNQHGELFDEYNKIVQAEVNLEELEGDEVDAKSVDFNYCGIYANRINNKVAKSRLLAIIDEFEKLKQENEGIFYYFDGIKDTIVSKGLHACGIISSPITVSDNIGVYYKDGDLNTPVSINGMKGVDSLNFTKFDILGLKTLGIIKDFYNYIGEDFKKSHNINFEDSKVWDNITETNIGLFQFESKFAYELMSEFKPRSVNDLSLVNASLRPSGSSYRDSLMRREPHETPSDEIAELLKDNYGRIIYQEDTIKFLTDICGFSGSSADNLRRSIGKKDQKALRKALPSVLEGYCNTSNKPREIAEREAQEFIQVIADSSEYSFGFNHSTGYSMLGYVCAWARTYYPLEFTTAYLNRAMNEDDLQKGDELCRLYNIKVNSIQLGKSKAEYMFDKEENSIYKGMESIKYMNKIVCDELFQLSQENTYQSFPKLLIDLATKTSLNSRQLRILTALNFFSEFGENKKLLTYTKYFDILNGKERFKKSNIHNNNLDIDETTKEKIHLELSQFEQLFIENSRQTDKTYMDLDTNSILLSIWNSMEDSKLSLKEQIETEIEFLGYIETKISSISDNIYFVSEFKIYDKNKPKPYVTLYSIKSGKYLKTRVDSDKDFIESVFNLGSIIRINKFITKPKFKIIDHKYVPTGETHELIKNWELMQ